MMALLFGPPGVGKGTQANLLSERYHFKKLSTGDMLREEVSSMSSFGDRLKGYLDRGALVPDNTILELVKSFLENNKEADILFDGFPRTLSQAKALDKLLTQIALSLKAAIEMYLDETEIVRRLSNRRYCPTCNRIYNYVTSPSRTSNVCDQCRTTLVKRSDDDADVIRERLRVYEKETRPLVDYYKSLGVYNRIDATGSQEQVFNRISEIINAHIN